MNDLLLPREPLEETPTNQEPHGHLKSARIYLQVGGPWNKRETEELKMEVSVAAYISLDSGALWLPFCRTETRLYLKEFLYHLAKKLPEAQHRSLNATRIFFFFNTRSNVAQASLT